MPTQVTIDTYQAETQVTITTNDASTNYTISAGARGPEGPNSITTATLSNLTGFISANGTNVSGATAGSTAATPSTLVLRNANGGVVFTSTTDAAALLATGNNATAANFQSVSATAVNIFSSAGTGAAISSSTGTAATVESGTGDHLDIGSGKLIVANNGDTTLTGAIAASNLSNTNTGDQFTSVTSQRLIGRHAGGTGAAQEVQVGDGIEFQGSGIRRSALTGDITATAGSNSTTLASTIAGNKTFSGNLTFSSTTRPTSSGTGTPGPTSLITAADRRKQEIEDMDNVYVRQQMGWETGTWVTVGASASSVIDGNSLNGVRFIGTTGLASSSAQGGGIKLPDGGLTGGSFVNFTRSWEARLLFHNFMNVTLPVAFFGSLRNNSNFWSNSSIGLYHVAQPPNSWIADTVYPLGDRINVAGIVFIVSTAGTSGASEPAFGTTLNGTTADNTVVWRHLGPHTSNKYALGTVSSLGVIALTDTGVTFVAGTSANTTLFLRSDGTNVYASVNGSAEISVARGAISQATLYIMARGDMGGTVTGRIAAKLFTYGATTQ